MSTYRALPPMPQRGPDAVNDDPFDISSLKFFLDEGQLFGREPAAGRRTAWMPPHADSGSTPDMRIPIEELFLPGGDSSSRR